EAVKTNITTSIAYSFSEGVRSYGEILAKYYNSINIPVKKSDIIVTTGGSEAIIFALNSIMNNGDEILIPEPFYANYTCFAMQCNAVVVPITARIENNFALPPIESFEDKITPKTKAIIICNPGNPTGYLYSKAELEKLRDIAVKHDLFIIADEVYRDFCYDGAKHVSIMEIEGMENHAIMIDSVSKKFSMCGVRVGAIVSRNREVMDAAMRLAQARLSPPLFGQMAAEGAFSVSKDYFEKVNAEYKRRRNFLVEELNKIPNVFCPMPKGAFYAIVKLPVDDVDVFAKWMLESFSYEGGTVMVAPASGFYATPGLGKQEARLAYVLEIEDLKKAVQILAKGIEAYNNR
ncbi:MAG: pyridoxal phosphate-dependent aminotransferase, partial [Rikenellaceae bacterium]